MGLTIITTLKTLKNMKILILYIPRREAVLDFLFCKHEKYLHCRSL